MAKNIIIEAGQKWLLINWKDVQFNKERRIEFFKLCKSLGIPTPEHPIEWHKKSYNTAKEVLVQMVNNESNKETKIEEREEEDTMKETITNNINEEAVKATKFVEASQKKVETAAEYTINAVTSVREVIKEVASMNSKDLEVYLKDNADTLWETIKAKVTESRDKLDDASKDFPELKERANKLNNILETFSEILDEDELSGWGKFKEIVKELVKWIVRIFLKVGQILLKIAVTVVVGAVKIAAVTIDTTFGVAGVLHKEVVKPTVKSAKSVYANHKERKAEKEAEFDEFDEMVEETAREMA